MRSNQYGTHVNVFAHRVFVLSMGFVTATLLVERQPGSTICAFMKYSMKCFMACHDRLLDVVNGHDTIREQPWIKTGSHEFLGKLTMRFCGVFRELSCGLS